MVVESWYLQGIILAEFFTHITLCKEQPLGEKDNGISLSKWCLKALFTFEIEQTQC